ncbi:MAG: TetR/AcrR family transcriptional regulator [Jiangellales bacterium]
MTSTATPLTERGRRTRDTLVSAARRVFESRGYAATRIQDVAAEAGVSHGTVYTWFPGKDELLREVTHSIVGEVVAAARERPRETRDPDAYARLASATRRFLLGYRRNARMLAVVEEAASADAEWSSLLDELREIYVDRTRRTLRRLQSDGVVAPDLDPDVAAPALTGMVETFARRTATAPAIADSDVEQLTRLWARAVGIPVPISLTRSDT